MKSMMKLFTCIAVIAVLMTAMVLPTFATGIRRPISGTENLIPTTAPSSGTTGNGIHKRPIRGEENLVPTTEPSSGTTGSGTPNKPIRGEENLIPTTPSPTPSGTIQKPTTPGTTSSGTSTVQPTESAT